PTDLDPLELVGPPGAAKLIALPLKATELLRGETILHGAQIAPGDAGLDVGEGALRPVGEPRRVEGRVHRANVSDPAIEIPLARRSSQHGPAPGRPARAGRAVGARIRGLRSSVRTTAQHSEYEEAGAADQQKLEESDAAAEAPAHTAEQHGADQSA